MASLSSWKKDFIDNQRRILAYCDPVSKYCYTRNSNSCVHSVKVGSKACWLATAFTILCVILLCTERPCSIASSFRILHLQSNTVLSVTEFLQPNNRVSHVIKAHCEARRFIALSASALILGVTSRQPHTLASDRSLNTVTHHSFPQHSFSPAHHSYHAWHG
jgi:hypothetical protein